MLQVDLSRLQTRLELQSAKLNTVLNALRNTFCNDSSESYIAQLVTNSLESIEEKLDEIVAELDQAKRQLEA